MRISRIIECFLQSESIRMANACEAVQAAASILEAMGSRKSNWDAANATQRQTETLNRGWAGEVEREWGKEAKVIALRGNVRETELETSTNCMSING